MANKKEIAPDNRVTYWTSLYQYEIYENDAKWCVTKPVLRQLYSQAKADKRLTQAHRDELLRVIVAYGILAKD
jgi:hypothetical protein